MSFDPLAPHYRWMEWVLAGGKLQRCRLAHLDRLRRPESALFLGEGNARSLTPFLRAHPGTRVCCLDASEGMLRAARSQLRKEGIDFTNVSFIHANILEWMPQPDSFDLIVTNFFLDCFDAETLSHVLDKISMAATPNAAWLLADFQEPSRGAQRWRAKLILKAMYFFFRHATKISARSIASPDSGLQRHGFVLEQRLVSEWGLLHSDLWKRRETPTPPSRDRSVKAGVLMTQFT
jgi:ubiquinone/menaquinone biosynthesis C-methylase UbiE